MKSLLIVANFKSHQTFSEAKTWLEEMEGKDVPGNKMVIVCPSVTHLSLFRSYVNEKNLPLKIGAQDVSRFPQGANTGEVNGSQIKEFADFVLIGHSERRKSGEDESIVEEKIRMSIDYGLTPILCVQGENEKIYPGISIVAYEPTFAIGTGITDDPNNANEIAKTLKEKNKIKV